VGVIQASSAWCMVVDNKLGLMFGAVVYLGWVSGGLGPSVYVLLYSFQYC